MKYFCVIFLMIFIFAATVAVFPKNLRPPHTTEHPKPPSTPPTPTWRPPTLPSGPATLPPTRPPPVPPFLSASAIENLYKGI